jgi:hypothetical protein
MPVTRLWRYPQLVALIGRASKIILDARTKRACTVDARYVWRCGCASRRCWQPVGHRWIPCAQHQVLAMPAPARIAGRIADALGLRRQAICAEEPVRARSGNRR